MLKIKNVKIVLVGNTYYLRVPKQYVDNGLIDPKTKYDYYLDDKQQNE